MKRKRRGMVGEKPNPRPRGEVIAELTPFVARLRSCAAAVAKLFDEMPPLNPGKLETLAGQRTALDTFRIWALHLSASLAETEDAAAAISGRRIVAGSPTKSGFNPFGASRDGANLSAELKLAASRKVRLEAALGNVRRGFARFERCADCKVISERDFARLITAMRDSALKLQDLLFRARAETLALGKEGF